MLNRKISPTESSNERYGVRSYNAYQMKFIELVSKGNPLVSKKNLLVSKENQKDETVMA